MSCHVDVVRRSRKGRGFDSRNSNVTYLKELKASSAEQQRSVPLKSLEGWILFVTNLNEETSEDDVKEAFSEYGEVKNINMNLDRRTGFVKGYALLEYEGYEQAMLAREYMNNSELLGTVIKVDWCFVSHPEVVPP